MIDTYDPISISKKQDHGRYCVKDLATGLFYHFIHDEAARAFCFQIERPAYLG